MSSKINNIQIGTANFFNSYGVKKYFNSKPNKLLNQLFTRGIRNLDLSNLYSFDMCNLNRIYESYNLSIKFSFEKDNSFFNHETFERYIDNINVKFPNSKISEILIHNLSPKLVSFDLFDHFFKYLQKNFDNFQQIVFGASIYNFDDYINLNKMFHENINILQIPCNIFDQRIIDFLNSSTYIKFQPKLSLRSIFLQGILLKRLSELPEYFSKFNKNFEKFDNFVIQNKISKLDACLGFAKNFDSRITIGIDSIDNFDEIYESYQKNPRNINFEYLSSNDISLTDPRLWKI